MKKLSIDLYDHIELQVSLNSASQINFISQRNIDKAKTNLQWNVHKHMTKYCGIKIKLVCSLIHFQADRETSTFLPSDQQVHGFTKRRKWYMQSGTWEGIHYVGI